MNKETDKKLVDAINQLFSESRELEKELDRSEKEYWKERNRVEKVAKELGTVVYKSLEWEELEFNVCNLQSGVKQKREEANKLIGIHQELIAGEEVEDLKIILERIEPIYQRAKREEDREK